MAIIFSDNCLFTRNINSKMMSEKRRTFRYRIEIRPLMRMERTQNHGKTQSIFKLRWVYGAQGCFCIHRYCLRFSVYYTLSLSFSVFFPLRWAIHCVPMLSRSNRNRCETIHSNEIVSASLPCPENLNHHRQMTLSLYVWLCELHIKGLRDNN